MKKIMRIFTIAMIAVIYFSSLTYVNADMGPKPSITIKIKNLNTTNYLIDLLVYDEDGRYYHDAEHYGGNENDITPADIHLLYAMNDDGWISESTR